MTKVAIVEDDALINQMYRMKFESEGFDVQVADNGKSGLEMIQTFQPNLVLLDLQMPEMTGDQVLKSMREQEWGKNTPVIILTNTGLEESPKILKELNVLSYFVKAELTPSQIVTKAKEALGI